MEQTLPTTAHEVGIEVGDFFAASWGYDQTNVDFWVVVGVTASGKSVRVRRCDTLIQNPSWLNVSGNGHHDKVCPGNVYGDVKTKRLQIFDLGLNGDYDCGFSDGSYSGAPFATWCGSGIFPVKSQTARGMGH